MAIIWYIVYTVEIFSCRVDAHAIIPSLFLIVLSPQLQRRNSCRNNCSDPYCVVGTVCLVCTHELYMTVSMVTSGILFFGGQTYKFTNSQTDKVMYGGRHKNCQKSWRTWVRPDISSTFCRFELMSGRTYVLTLGH